MKCPICQGLMSLYINKTKTRIFKCTNCGLGKTQNLDIRSGNYHRDTTYVEEEALFRNIFQKRVDNIFKFRKNGRVLEVGCSTGLMLSLLKKDGWDVLGIEPSKNSAGVAIKRHIEVISQPFEKVHLYKKFDLIIFNHTLEHLGEPVEILEKASSLLKKGGLIYIDLPNFGGLTARILGTQWSMLLPEEHRWHFTLESLTLLLRRLKFEVIYTERASGVWDYANPFKGILLSLLNFKKRFFSETITALPSWALWKMDQGSDLMIIAKKI